MAAVQRARVVRALADVMAVDGYANTPVSAVLARAGVSRETFYQLFRSKQDCFIAALDDALEQLGRDLASVASGPGLPLATFERAVTGYLGRLAAEPAMARLFLIETYAAGPEAMVRRLDLHRQFVDRLADMFDLTGSTADRFSCEAVVATLIATVTAAFVRGDEEHLLDLGPAVVELARRLLLPSGTRPVPGDDTGGDVRAVSP